MEPANMNPNASLPQFEDIPLTRAEYITAITHFYRAETHRSTVWRMRLDTTTNWSILSVMGLVSFAMAESERSQAVIVVGMLLVLNFLVIEARRFRFFDVWRSRVRMLEQNFVGPILQRSQISRMKDWGDKVAGDLVSPRFKLTWHQALRVRLMRNYLPMFVLLLACWLIKVESMYTNLAEPNLSEFLQQRLKYGDVPNWVSIIAVVSLYLYLTGVICFVKSHHIADRDYWTNTLHEVRNFDQ